MQNASKVLIFIALFVAISACRIEPEPPLPPTPWKLLVADPDIWNVQGVENQLFVQTSTSLYTLDSTGAKSPCMTFDSTQFQISISKSIVAKPSSDGKYVDFYATKNVCGGPAKRVYLSQFGIPPLYTFNPINRNYMLATDAGQFICPFVINPSNYGLSLFSVAFTDAAQTRIDTVKVQKIDLPDAEQFFEMHEFKQKVYIGYRSKFEDFRTIVLQPEGSWQPAFPDLNPQLFELGNTTYAIGFQNFYTSQDNENTWSSASNLYDSSGWPGVLPELRFASVNDKLIALYRLGGPKLFVIEETADSNFEKYWELDHSGLDDISIYTDILLQWDRWVYLRTEKGVFNRPLAEFFTAKQ